MGQPRSERAQSYYRAAKERLDDARLLEKYGRYPASIYLGGYAVECMLKALLLNNTPQSQWNRIEDLFRGSLGHDQEALKERLAGTSGTNIPFETMRWFRTTVFWSTSMRYESKKYKPKQTSQFLQAVTEICRWAERSM